MARVVAIGADVFEDMRTHGDFLVDKTSFIGSWWRARHKVTLLCRPRRFGKTLTLSMVERFLSNLYRRDAEMMGLAGTVPVISVSLAGMKDPTFEEAQAHIKQVLCRAVRKHRPYLLDSDAVDAEDKAFLRKVSDDMDDEVALTCLSELCRMLHEHWGTKPVVLLDEYDTPLVEAQAYGYWDAMVSFVGGLFNSTFKTNPSLGRALVFGITRVAQESIFSGMNNPAVVTTTTPLYETDFGFTQDEVDAALAEIALSGHADEVRQWYDGFTFGSVEGIYNPWSITNFLKFREAEAYWANTSSNALVGQIVRGHPSSMHDLEALFRGETIVADIGERVNFRTLTPRRAPYDRCCSRRDTCVSCGCTGRRPSRVGERGGSVPRSSSSRSPTVRWRSSFRTWRRAGSTRLQMASGDLPGRSWGRCRCRPRETLLYSPSLRVEFRLGYEGLPCGWPRALLAWARSWHGDRAPRRGLRRSLEHGERPGAPRRHARPQRPSLRACVLEFKVAQGDGAEAMERSCAEALEEIERKRYDEAILSRGVAASRITHFGIALHGRRVLVRRG